MKRTKDAAKGSDNKQQKGKTKSKKPQPKDPDELELELREVFDRFDEDKNGTVSVTEIRRMLQVMGQNPTKAEVEAMVKDYDDNQNGQLDFEEFKELIISNLKDDEVEQTEMRDAFAVFDKDGNGFIDKQELAKVLRTTGEKLDCDELDAVFSAIDTNGDGKINYEEFAAAMAQCDISN